MGLGFDWNGDGKDGLFDDMVGIVVLVDGNHDPERIVGKLDDRIYDQAVVLLSVIGSDHVEAVADREEGLHIVLVGLFLIAGQIVDT